MRRFFALVVVLLLAAACGGDDAAVAEVGIDDAVEAVAERGVVVLDVRTPEEFAAGHLEGAVNLDAQDPAFRDQVAELDRDGAYVVYCRTGNRSAAAAAVMEELGFDDVRTVTGGGFAELAAAGAPVAG